jgi:hypothetical protein
MQHEKAAAQILPQMVLLEACMDRMLAEHTFNPSSYLAGDVNTNDLYPMVTSFLLISVKNAPGAARFANGEWADLPRLLPLIGNLMMAAGWSAGCFASHPSRYRAIIEEVNVSLCTARAIPAVALRPHVRKPF